MSPGQTMPLPATDQIILPGHLPIELRRLIETVPSESEVKPPEEILSLRRLMRALGFSRRHDDAPLVLPPQMADQDLVSTQGLTLEGVRDLGIALDKLRHTPALSREEYESIGFNYFLVQNFQPPFWPTIRVIASENVTLAFEAGLGIQFLNWSIAFKPELTHVFETFRHNIVVVVPTIMRSRDHWYPPPSS
ncbi:MAG: hypothetical protein AAGC72_15455 [Planctomycetota bacterium]